jgi:hypothetical protein
MLAYMLLAAREPGPLRLALSCRYGNGRATTLKPR